VPNGTRAGGGLRRDDLTAIPDAGHPHDVSPETVFGAHWPADPLLQRQYARELESWLDGRSRFRSTVDRAGQSHDAGHLSPLRRLIAHWIDPVAEVIETCRTRYLAEGSGRGGGRPPTWLVRTAHLEAQTLAATIVEVIVDPVALGRPMPQPALAAALGQAVETLHVIGLWEQKNPALLRAYFDRLKAAGATEGAETRDVRQPCAWTAPMGWPWVMAYGAREKRHAHVRVGGIRSTALVYAESEDQIDRLRQTDAISPNVIHALDAAALVFAIDGMTEVTAIAAIHDCVGGLAPEMTAISQAVRDGFARLYEDHDPLQAIYRAALAQLDEADRYRLQLPPEPGDLDVGVVRGAGYFFS